MFTVVYWVLSLDAYLCWNISRIKQVALHVTCPCIQTCLLELVKSFQSFNIVLQPPVRYWQESPKDATNENTAKNDEHDPKPMPPRKQTSQKVKKIQKAKKRKQHDDQPGEKTFLSGVRTTF